MVFLVILTILFACLIIRLAFAAAAHALSLYAGLAAGFCLRAAEYGLPVCIGAGFLAGLLTAMLGRHVYQHTHSPAMRCALALAFTVPAACAAFQLAQGILLIVAIGPLWRTPAAFAAAIAVGRLALQGLRARPARA